MKAERGAWLAALGGGAAFLAFTHGAILDPGYTGWLFSHPDTATGYLGWQFYRQAPLWQLPFGATPAYGMEIASSVVFSDSIPLLALLLRPLSAWLPGEFQYFGLWLALCFVLQALFAYRLLARFGVEPVLALLGSAFFVMAPPYLFRLSGHYALCAQWIVLAALHLYFSPRASLRAWGLLLAGSVLVHFYLFAMAVSVWLADLWQRQWRGELAPRRAAHGFLATAALVFALMWFAGYFTIGAGASATPGFGNYRMNLLAPIDPDRIWSRLLPDQPGGRGDHEGLSYLGTGMLALAVLAAGCLVWRRRLPRLERPAAVPLAVLSVLLTVYAVSNRVSAGGADLFTYDVPVALQPITDLLRVSGRMFWPVYYLLCLGILLAVVRLLPRRVAIGACAALLVAQVADSWRALEQYHARLAHAPAWVSPLRSALWGQIGARSERLVYVLPRNAIDAYLPWAAFAAEHRLPINFGYFARVDAEKLTAARNGLEEAVLAGRLQPRSLYVFESDPLWNLAWAQRRPGDLAGVLDGFRIMAPALGACDGCALGDLRRDEGVGYVLGEPIELGAAARRRYPMGGWSPPEPWGVWSQARVASLIIRLARVPAGDLRLTLEARAFVNSAHDQQRVVVSVNGVSLDTLTFAAAGAAEARSVRIPHAALDGNKGLVMMRFVFPDARTPRELGMGDEELPRALGLVTARLDEF